MTTKAQYVKALKVGKWVGESKKHTSQGVATIILSGKLEYNGTKFPVLYKSTSTADHMDIERELVAQHINKVMNGLVELPAYERRFDAPDVIANWDNYKGGESIVIQLIDNARTPNDYGIDFAEWAEKPWTQRDNQDDKYIPSRVAELRRMVAFDYIIDNSDRHTKNALIRVRPKQKQRELVLIDHGYAFRGYGYQARGLTRVFNETHGILDAKAIDGIANLVDEWKNVKRFMIKLGFDVDAHIRPMLRRVLRLADNPDIMDLL